MKNAVLEEDVGGAQNVLPAVHRVGDVVEAAGRALYCLFVKGDVVGLVRAG